MSRLGLKMSPKQLSSGGTRPDIWSVRCPAALRSDRAQTARRGFAVVRDPAGVHICDELSQVQVHRRQAGGLVGVEAAARLPIAVGVEPLRSEIRERDACARAAVGIVARRTEFRAGAACVPVAAGFDALRTEIRPGTACVPVAGDTRATVASKKEERRRCHQGQTNLQARSLSNGAGPMPKPNGRLSWQLARLLQKSSPVVIAEKPAPARLRVGSKCRAKRVRRIMPEGRCPPRPS